MQKSRIKGEKRKTHLMKTKVIVQVKKGSGRRAIQGVLNKYPVFNRWRNIKGHLMDVGWSLLAFALGLLLASLYGLTALFLQKQSLWFCVYSTLAMAVLAAFSMGLSAGIRADVMILLPSLCSARGKNFVLFLFVTVLLAGPVTNIIENMKRADASLLCSAELAANQTQELMQRAKAPLFSALDRIRAISSNAHAVAGRVQNLIHALTDGVRHVAHTLRNVLHFLADMGDICNAELGSPYRKCRKVFGKALDDCFDQMGDDFSFLCHIVGGFIPLCDISRVGEFFCIIPSYISSQLKKRLEAATVEAFEQMKRQFDFNISASASFDLDTNSNRSLQDISQDIIEEVSSDLKVFQKLREPLTYGGLILLVISYLRAAWYRWRYLRHLDFDNIYISSQFKELDEEETSWRGGSVLPVTHSEAKTYITPLSFHLTSREWKAVLKGVISVFYYLVIGSILVALDFLAFWMLDLVHHQVKGDIVARAPVTMAVLVSGSGYASDIFRDVVASFDVLQRGKITVISKKCLLEPSEPDYTTCFILGFLLGLALLFSLAGGFIQRCRRLICASYYPERELERIRFLRQHIIDQRKVVGRALRSAARSRAGRGRGGGSRLQTLLLWLPGGTCLSHLLGLSSVTCLSCGKVIRQEKDNMAACDVPQCPGVDSTLPLCVACARPVTFQEDSEEYSEEDGEGIDNSDSSDNSDDEQLNITDRKQEKRPIWKSQARQSTVEV